MRLLKLNLGFHVIYHDIYRHILPFPHMKAFKLPISLLTTLICLSSYATNYYINDGTMDGDELWTDQIGNDANNGTTVSTPKLTFASVVGTYNLTADDTVFIDVGSYTWSASDAIAPDGDGTSGNEIVIIGAGIAKTIITASGTDNALDLNKFDYIIFRDFKLTNSNGGVLVNIQADAGNNCTNITFRDVELAQTRSSQAVTIPTDANNLYFRGCTVSNTQTQPAFNIDGDNIYLDACTVTSPTTANGTIAINTNCSYIAIDSCTVNQTGANAAAILINGGATTADITYNTITATADHSKGFLAYSTANVSITDNEFIITDAAGVEYGIDFQTGATGAEVERNWIKGGDYGMRLSNSGAGSGTIYNNVFANNKYGLKIDANTAFDIYYNTFRTTNQCCQDCYLASSEVKNNIFASTGNNTVYCVEINSTNKPGAAGDMVNNAYYYPNGAYPVRYNGTNYDALAGGTNNWNTDIGYDANSIDNQDPLFMGAADDNLSLHESTPLANLGVDLSPTVTDDIWKAARDASPFIGAYETSAGSILPVEWLYWEGNCAGGNIMLSWGTASEVNNDHFVIEFSEDGENFETIDRVWGAGTTNHPQHYKWLEESEDGLYRLRQVDYDGQGEANEWIEVSCATGHGFNLLKAREMFNNLYLQTPLEHEISGDIEIYNVHGQLVKTKSNVWIGNGRNAHIPITDIGSGVFWAIIKSDATTDLVAKFVR